jgi:hypothetical protein
LKLEPVFLLQPEPPPARMSRRAFGLALAATAAAGIGIGFALRREDTTPAHAAEDDPQLRWSLSLARLRGTVDALVAQHVPFLLVVWQHGHAHRDLWLGVRKLADAVLAPGAIDQTRRIVLARSLVQTLDAYAHPSELDPMRERLRSLAR